MNYLELSKYELFFNINVTGSKDRIFLKNLTSKRIAFKVVILFTKIIFKHFR